VPLYEYQCRVCGKLTEVRHGFDESPARQCEACGGELARRFSPAGIVFKGSGFYVTDSRKSAEAKAGAAKGAGKEAAAKDAPKDGAAKSPEPSQTKTDAAKEGGATASSSNKGEGAAA